MTDSPFVEASISVGAILARTGDLLRRSAFRVTIALALLAAPSIAIESGLVDGSGEYALTFLDSALWLVVQFWLTRALLDELGAGGSGRTRFLAFFGLVLLSGLGVLIGLVFLVVPGIIFLIRWSISVPILLGSDAGVLDSMHRSWRETERHFWPILGAFAAIHAPTLLVVVVAFFEGATATPLPAVIAAILVLQAAAIAGWYAAVAICTLLAEPGTLSKVFE